MSICWFCNVTFRTIQDICEDISDHVEQIHALLETEFSLKLLSYSVNVIVDIHTVQLLWHQLRVSVLVLRERILQGLQDTNGNYTRQADILQAFSEETQEDRLDSLTEVDDSGQLTIKCSQNYLSLDCGITAFELSDYSPSEDLLGGLGDVTSSCTNAKPLDSLSCSDMEKDFPELVKSVGLLTVSTEPVASETIEGREDSLLPSTESQSESNISRTTRESPGLSLLSPSGMPFGSKDVYAQGDELDDRKSVYELVKQDCHPTQKSTAPRGKLLPHCENSISKRPIRDCFNYNEDSPTQPTLPKRGLFQEEDTEVFHDDRQANGRANRMPSLILKSELSRSTPSLMELPDKSKLCLSLQSSYCCNPSIASQSYDCLFKMKDRIVDNTIKNSHKDNTVSPSRSDGHNPKEKRRHKKSYDTSEVNPGQTSKVVANTTSPKQDKKWTSAEENGIPSDISQSLEETDSTSMPLIFLNQATPSTQIQSNTDPSLLPYDQKMWSSSGSGTRNASTSALLNSKSIQGCSSSSYASSNGKNCRAWYGSDEYLALPSHLKQTEVLALKLENLAKLVPQNSIGETLQNIDDWELSEMNSDSEMYPIFPINKKHKRMGQVSPSSSSDIAPSLDDSIESGPLSDILSDDDLLVPVTCAKKYTEKLESPLQDQSSVLSEKPSTSKYALIQQLMQDIQHQENYEAVWEKIEGFVRKLDEFIHWLKEAMETSENWTPPKAETDSLKLYLETHLSFKLNVDSHCALKEAVVEEGRQLLELIVSHKSGLKDMLPMIASQWKELQRQIKRQHSWILKALDLIKAEILASDVSVEDEEGTGSPKADVQLCYLEAKRDAVEQMSLKLYSEQYMSSSKRRDQFVDMPKIHALGSNSLLDFESDYQELWDWLIDMESIVMDSHGLMMSEEQQQHLYKRYSVEMSIREPKKLDLLNKVGYLKKNGAVIPGDLLEKVESIHEKWELLGKTLGEKIQGAVGGQSKSSPRDVLSPESGNLVRELEVQIKELKGWLRETELFIFNSCLRRQKGGEMDAEKQLQYFKSLCCEIKQRRRGVSSVLRLCQHLLENQETCNLDADHQSMQLIIVNLERRWEAIVMQAVQWQTRLQKKLGRYQETIHIIDLDLMNLNGTNEDALEWDETDISHKLICINEDSNNLEQEQKFEVPVTASDLEGYVRDNQNEKEYVVNHASSSCFSNVTTPNCPLVYQIYNLHNVELYERNHVPFLHKTSKPSKLMSPNYLQKNLSKDSSFSSTKSLLDIVSGNSSFRPYNDMYCGELSRISGSESGIVSEGDTETTTNSESLLADMGGAHCQLVDTKPLDFQMAEIVNVLKQKMEDKQIIFPGSCQPITSAHWTNEKDRDFKLNPKYTSKCLEKEMQEKHDVFTFYDYSYLQGSRHNWPILVKRVQAENLIENGHVEEDTSAPGFCFDGMHCRTKDLESQRYESILPISSGKVDVNSLSAMDSVKILMSEQTESRFPCLSHGSSLDSLSTAGDLFGSNISKPRDGLQRSTSLESWLVSCKSNEDLFSRHSSGDISISSDSVGELSKRTLDLLKRLEDIESPSEQKIKNSISDMTLQSTSQKMSLIGQHSLDLAFSMNEDSAASLTELSSSDELSLCSEDIVLHINKIPDSNASFQKHLNQAVADESDVNVSMIVNVSCTSACTDDEDDSDLLSSSTLTLTEEELCIKDEDDDSSIATDDDIYEESNFLSGIDYIKNELHTWSRPKFLLLREKKKCNLSDSICCEKEDSANMILTATDILSAESALSSSSCRFAEGNGNSRNVSDGSGLNAKSQTQKNSFQIDKDQLVDDMENGNVEGTDVRSKGGFIKYSVLEGLGTVIESIPERGCSACALLTDSPDKIDPGSQVCCLSKPFSKDYQNDLGSSSHQNKSTCSFPITNSCSVSVLKDKDKDMQNTPCLASECEDQHNDTNVHEKSRRCCSRFIETNTEALASASGVSCCRCESMPSDKQIIEECSVHNFVMEIIDMASMALKNKSQSESEVVSPTSLTQIKEKVLEHSHRPIQLRKGDFYSYLSLSSHDSDCGEVASYTEDKSSTPVPKDFPEISLDGKDDIEYIFEACTEEELPEEQSCLPSYVTEGSMGSDNLVSLDESKALVSLQLDKMDIQVPSSVNQKVTNVKDDSATVNTCNKGSYMNTVWCIPMENKRDDAFGNEKPKSSIVTSTKASMLNLSLKSSNIKGKNILHHNTKTLTCEENLQPFHKKTNKSLMVEGNPSQLCQASHTKKPGLNTGADSSSKGQGGL